MKTVHIASKKDIGDGSNGSSNSVPISDKSNVVYATKKNLANLSTISEGTSGGMTIEKLSEHSIRLHGSSDSYFNGFYISGPDTVNRVIITLVSGSLTPLLVIECVDQSTWNVTNSYIDTDNNLFNQEFSAVAYEILLYPDTSIGTLYADNAILKFEVYADNDSDSQTTIPYSVDPIPNSLVQRNDVGEIQGEVGPEGPKGADGREIELRKTSTYVQWRYLGDSSWTNLIPLSELKGSDGIDGEIGLPGTDGTDGEDGIDGREVELRKTATHIQWRLTGGTWTNLIPLSDLTGADGKDGEDGDPAIAESDYLIDEDILTAATLVWENESSYYIRPDGYGNHLLCHSTEGPFLYPLAQQSSTSSDLIGMTESEYSSLSTEEKEDPDKFYAVIPD